jgi:hypothetical protein
LLQYHSIVRWAIQAQWAEPLVYSERRWLTKTCMWFELKTRRLEKKWSFYFIKGMPDRLFPWKKRQAQSFNFLVPGVVHEEFSTPATRISSYKMSIIKFISAGERRGSTNWPVGGSNFWSVSLDRSLWFYTVSSCVLVQCLFHIAPCSNHNLWCKTALVV